MTTTFIATHLSEPNHYYTTTGFLWACFVGPGIPYDVRIIPVNLAGEGESRTETYFTQELSK